MSLHIDLREALSKAEGMHHQLMEVASQLPDAIRTIIGLEPLKKSPELSNINVKEENLTNGVPAPNEEVESVTIDNDEVSFERGLSMSYIWNLESSFVTFEDAQTFHAPIYGLNDCK